MTDQMISQCPNTGVQDARLDNGGHGVTALPSL